jgi:hypothetical protein
VATLADLDRLALALPETAKEHDDEGRPSYVVGGRWFCFHRAPRKDAPFDDVLAFRTTDLETKELVLADPRGIWFTTPHWNGYAGVLLRIPDLARLSEDELREAVEEAWLAKAPKRLAKAWLAANE